MFKLNFWSVMENKRILFVEASEGEIKKLVDNSAQRNKKKSVKYTGTIHVRSPCEIIGFTANCSFFGQSFSLRHYPPIYQPPKGV